MILKIEYIRLLIFIFLTTIVIYVYLQRTFVQYKNQRLHYQRLFEENPNPMWIYDLETLQFLAVNTAAIVKYGYSKDEFLRMNLRDIRPKEDIPLLENYEKEGREKFADNGIWRHRQKNGEVFFTHIYSHRIDFRGKKACLVTALDVNKRVLAERQNQQLTHELSEKKNYLKSLLDTPTNFLIIRIDLEGRYTYANASFCKKFGLPPERIIGKSYITTIPPEDRQYFRELIDSCIQMTGETLPLRVYTHNATKKEVVIDWEFTCILDEQGRPEELQGIGQDVTEKVQYLDQLTAYKAQLSEIMDTVNDIIWSLRIEDFSIVYINQACERMYGYTPEEFRADSTLWFSRIHEEDKPKVQEAIANLVESGRNELEYRIRNKDGSLRYMLDRSVAVRDENGKVERVNGVATDVTRLRMAEQEAKENARRVEDIVESITDGFFTVDKDWNFTYVNRESERMLKINRGDLLGKNFWECYPNALRSKYYHEYNRAVQEQVSVHFDEYAPTYKMWTRVSAYPTPEGLAVYFRNITESRQLQEQIIQAKNNMDSLINNTNDFIWSVDREFRILTANNAYKQHLLKVTGRPIGEGDVVLVEEFGEERNARWRSYYQRALAGETYSTELSTLYGISEATYTEINFNPIVGKDGNIVGVGCFLRNITQRKLYELKIQKQNEKLREIAWIQSHKVRAPLSNIMGLISLLNYDDPTDTENKDVLEKLLKAAQKMDAIIHDIVRKTHEVDDDNT